MTASKPTRHDPLPELIRQLYAAPGTQDAWAPFLDSLCLSVGGVCAHFLSVNTEGHAGVTLTVRMDPAARALYEQHWGAFDPWGHSVKLRSIPAGSVVFGEQLVPHAELQRTPFYAEFAAPNDLVRNIVGMIETAPGTLSVVSVGRTERQGPFAIAERALVSALMPHLRRALELHRRIAVADGMRDTMAGVLDSSARAIFMITPAGKVCWMNRAADRMTRSRDGLAIDRGELCAIRPSDTVRLRALLQDAVATATGHGTGTGGWISLGRPTGRRPLAVLVAPVAGTAAGFWAVESSAAVVVASDPDRQKGPDEHVTRELFGLTPGEARLACLLAQGLSLDEAATRLALRAGSARSRLKAIFEKTDTHRQADLVRLMLLAGSPL